MYETHLFRSVIKKKKKTLKTFCLLGIGWKSVIHAIIYWRSVKSGKVEWKTSGLRETDVLIIIIIIALIRSVFSFIYHKAILSLNFNLLLVSYFCRQLCGNPFLFPVPCKKKSFIFETCYNIERKLCFCLLLHFFFTINDYHNTCIVSCMRIRTTSLHIIRFSRSILVSGNCFCSEIIAININNSVII